MRLDDSFGLTPIQFRIAVLLAEGLTHKEIAHKLSMGMKAMEGHIYGQGHSAHSIEARLGVRGKSGIVKWVHEHGLLKHMQKPNLQQPLTIDITSTPQLAQALMKCAQEAANGKCDPTQVSALCQATQAFINLARLQMEVVDRKHQSLPWLLG